MRENALKRLWAEDKPALGGWLTNPSSASAEVMARTGFDWICIDTQHGLIDYQMSVDMLRAISTTDAVPIVRVPWNEPGIIMKSLDAGAYGVIVPMVNTRSEAEAAVSYCRYAPHGVRSYGPARVVLYAGRDYFQHANETVLCIVMIETAQALENLDDILSVPGVDVAYIGPADLSVSLGFPPASYHEDPKYATAVQSVVDACRRYGVMPGFHGGNPDNARARIAQGFRFVEVCEDTGALARAAAADLSTVRGQGADVAESQA